MATLKEGRGKVSSSAVKRSGIIRSPKWLKHAELRDANDHYDQDAVSADQWGDEELRSRTKRVLREELDFINNPMFLTPNAAETVFADNLGVRPFGAVSESKKVRLAGLPVHLGRMCEADLLTPDQERVLFQRMNFLRHQAMMVRSRLDHESPSRSGLALFYRLVGLAEWHRDAIVRSNLRLVFSIVKKFVNANNAFDDLLSDGIVALIRAVEKFDYDRGFRFSTYATQVVRRNAYRTVVQRQKERSKVAGGIQEMGLDISDEERTPAISEHRWHELRSRLTVMLGDLDRREKLIIRARFSLGSHRKVQTLQALADRLGVSKERVRQLEKRALDKLRSMAGEVKLAELDPEE